MGKSHSTDLRERGVAFVNAGHSRRAAARHFGISDSCVIKLLQHWQATGSTAPLRQGRPKGSGRLSACLDVLIARVKEQPDITMPELAAVLQAERGVEAHPASLSKLLRRAGYTYKKTADGGRARTPRHPRQAPHLDHPPPAAHAP